jgi:hypothetical protein
MGTVSDFISTSLHLLARVGVTVLRDFRIKEKVTLGVRADAFGFTNTPHFANPNLSCPASATAPGPVADWMATRAIRADNSQ